MPSVLPVTQHFAPGLKRKWRGEEGWQGQKGESGRISDASEWGRVACRPHEVSLPMWALAMALLAVIMALLFAILRWKLRPAAKLPLQVKRGECLCWRQSLPLSDFALSRGIKPSRSACHVHSPPRRQQGARDGRRKWCAGRWALWRRGRRFTHSCSWCATGAGWCSKTLPLKSLLPCFWGAKPAMPHNALHI